MKRRPAAIAGVMLAVTFAVGGLTGMAFEEALGIDWFEFLDRNASPDRAMLADLGLTASQKATIGDIFARQENHLAAYWEGRLPEIRTIVARTDEEIREVLTAEQRVLFDQRLRARERKVKSEM